MDESEYFKVERRLSRATHKAARALLYCKGPLDEKIKLRKAVEETREALRVHRLNRWAGNK